MVKVKICGFTDPKDVEIACDLGADMVGVILVPGSSRCLTITQAKEVLASATDKVAGIAVVKPESLIELKKFADLLKPDYLQIHFTFPPDELKKLKRKLGVGFILVAPIPRKVENRQRILENAMRIAEAADIILVDTKGPTGGGTGLTHDWSISREIKDAVHKPVFLAGGLSPSNVAEAIKAVRPDGVDVATGVESSPGKKNPKLMRAFIEAARGI